MTTSLAPDFIRRVNRAYILGDIDELQRLFIYGVRTVDDVLLVANALEMLEVGS